MKLDALIKCSFGCSFWGFWAGIFADISKGPLNSCKKKKKQRGVEEGEEQCTGVFFVGTS